MATELLELGKSEEASDEFVIAQGEEAHLWLKGDNNGEVTGAGVVLVQRKTLAGGWTTFAVLSSTRVCFIVAIICTFRLFRPEQGTSVGVDREE